MTTADSTAEPVQGWNLFHSPARFALFLALLVAAAFPDVLFAQNTFFFRDFALFGYPLAQFHRESFWRGELPLWNPLNDCGIPYLAQWNTMVLYPGSLIYLLLPLPWSLGIFCLAHLFWAGVGMFCLARRWTGSPLAAACAGVAYCFSGLLLQSLMWPNNVAAFGWAPWVIGAAERGWAQGGRALFVAAAFGAIQMLTGAPEIIFITWLLIGALFLENLVPSRIIATALSSSVEGEKSGPKSAASSSPHTARRCFRFGTIVALVAGMSAIQLLPFRDLLAHSHRSALPHTSGWAMPAWGWANLFLPLFGTHPGYFGVPVQPGQSWTASYYLGIGTLALALWATAVERTRRVWLLAGAMLIGLLLALGERGLIYSGLREILPGLGTMRYPIKCVVLTQLAAPLLAAYGIARWTGTSSASKRSGKRLLLFTMGGFAFVTIALIVIGNGAAATPPGAALLTNGITRIALLALIGGGLFLATSARSAVTRAWIYAAVPVLFCLDGLSHAPRLSPTVANWVYDPHLVDRILPDSPRPRLGQSRAMVSPRADHELQFSCIADPAQNHVSRRAALFNNLNLLEAIPKVNGIYSLYPKAEAEILTRLYASEDQYPGPLADFLAVSQVSAQTNLFGWERRCSARPWISGGQRAVFAAPSDVLDHVTSPAFDPRQEVCFASVLKPFVGDVPESEVQIGTPEFEPGRIRFDVSSSSRAVVSLAQTYYHWWTCSVDGSPVPLLEANHAFQALLVPAGQHHVELRYRDQSFQVGLAISAICLIACGAGLLLAKPSIDDGKLAVAGSVPGALLTGV